MSVPRLLVTLLLSGAVAAGNVLVAGNRGGTGLAWLVGAPRVLAAVVALLPSRQAVAAPAAPTAAAPPAEPEGAAAFRLLALLQQEGRFVDFVNEDLTPYADEQIGAAVRGIHEGCRKALAERVAFEPVLRVAEGETVTLEPGFDAAAIRLTGNVAGAPPFRGVLRHAGWRVVRGSFPGRRGQDLNLIAPAEVEIP
jgi:hypothetical protein